MRIILTDFKNHDRLDATIDSSTAITGRNGSGKTSVLEAIMFAYYGRDFWGKIAVDGFVQKGKPGCSVVVDAFGMVVKRTFGKEGSVYINGVKMRQTDFISKFPPMDLAYALVNPMHMLYNINPMELRSLFMTYIPTRDRVEIFKEKYSSDEDLVSRFEVSDYESIHKAKKSLLNTIDSLDRDEQYKLQELASLEAQKKEIMSKRVRKPKGVLTSESKKQDEINDMEYKRGLLEGSESELKSIDDRLEIIKEKLKIPFENTGTSKITELLEVFAKDYQEKRDAFEEQRDLVAVIDFRINELEGLSGKTECPTCGSNLSNIDGHLKVMKENKADESLLLEKRKLELEEAEDMYISIKDVVQEVRSLQERRPGIKKKASEYKNLGSKIKKAREKLVGLSEDAFKKAVESEAQTKMLISIKDTVRSHKDSIERIKQSRKETRAELEDILILEEALSPKGVRADQAMSVAEVIAEELKAFVGENVSVKTVRKNKSNDRFREVFDVRINGVHFSNLSFGERMLVTVVFGIILRKYVPDFMFDFILLDEASVLSQEKLDLLQKYVEDHGLRLVYTKASEDDLNLASLK